MTFIVEIVHETDPRLQAAKMAMQVDIITKALYSDTKRRRPLPSLLKFS